MKKKVTVYDIAKELNISSSTVSRVLNNSNLISNKRSEEILEIAKKLGYEKRVIKKHASRAILNIYIFLPNSKNRLSHYFYNYSELIESVQKGFGDVKINFITRVNDNNVDFFKIKKSAHIDGCIFSFTLPSKNMAEILRDKNIPFIELNRNSGLGSSVSFDIDKGMELLTNAIIDSNRPNIKPCYIGQIKQSHLSIDRFNVAKEIFNKHNIVFNKDSYIEIENPNNTDEKLFSWIIDNNFNTIMTFNDLIAISLQHEANSRGYTFPKDFILTGFDNSPIQLLLNKKIDTIDLSISLIGNRAGLWLKKWIVDREEIHINDLLPIKYIKGNTIIN